MGDSDRRPTLDGCPALVIAHRGASGELPEHTLEAYARAIEQGADFIEPDLVATRDGHLVARHEPNLTQTTDVARRPEFAGLRRKRVIDGIEEDGWFACDFTLDEIRRLRAVQPVASRSKQFDGRFAIPTLDEIIALARKRAAESGRAVGIYPETKHPTWHRSIGLPIEERLLAVLEPLGWIERDAPVIVQSFEPSSLKLLRLRTRLRLVQLIGAADVAHDGTLVFRPPSDRPFDWTVAGDKRLYRDMLSTPGLAEIKTYADGIGPWKRFIVSVAGPDRKTLPPTDLIARAHAAGLFVHAWTFRDEPVHLAADYGGDPAREYRQFLSLGVDGVFSDFPGTAVRARVIGNR